METNVFIKIDEVEVLTYIKKKKLLVIKGFEYSDNESDFTSKPCVITLSKKTFLDLQNQFFEGKNRYYESTQRFAGVAHPTYAEEFQLTGETTLLTGFEEIEEDFEPIIENVNVYYVSKFEEVDMEHG